MAGVNKVILLGRLGADPEIRNLPSGSKVASFSLATSEAYTDKTGNRIEQTEWHRVELWDTQANLVEQYLKKGDMLYVEGKIRTEKWTDQNGQERFTTKIRGTSMNFVGGKGGGANTEDAPSAPQYAPINTPKASTPAPDLAPKGGEDDLPF